MTDVPVDGVAPPVALNIVPQERYCLVIGGYVTSQLVDLSAEELVTAVKSAIAQNPGVTLYAFKGTSLPISIVNPQLRIAGAGPDGGKLDIPLEAGVIVAHLRVLMDRERNEPD